MAPILKAHPEVHGRFTKAKIAQDLARPFFLFVFAWLAGWLGHACTDYSTMYPDLQGPIHAGDSTIVREILDANGLNSVTVESVSVVWNGRVQEIQLSRLALDSFRFPDTSIYLAHLRRVDLSRNHLADIPVSVWKLPALRELILDSNRLVAVSGAFFSASQGTANGLTLLSISHNQITNLSPLISQLRGLNRIILNANRLESLPLEIGSLPNLRENRGRVGEFGLDIAYNRICTPSLQVDSLLGRYARLGWRQTQMCPDRTP